MCEEERVGEWLQEQIEDGSEVYFFIGLAAFIGSDCELLPGSSSASHQREPEATNRHSASGERLFKLV